MISSIVFLPFVMNVFKTNEWYAYRTIQVLIQKKYDFFIPIHIIEFVLEKCKNKGYLKRKGNRYIMTEKGNEYISKFNLDKEVERKINYLFEDIRKYFEEKGIIMTREDISTLFLDFVTENIVLLIEFINPDYTYEDKYFKVRKDTNLDILIEYILNADKIKPDIYQIIEEIIYGSIISVILYTRNKTELSKLEKEEFKDIRVYLDTNFIFSLLGFHLQEFNRPAQELYKMLKNYNIDLYVFDFTIDEICRVINGYATEYYKYSGDIQINSVYSGLRKKGWKLTDAKRFIVDVEKILEEYSIKIEITDKENLNKYETLHPEYVTLLNKYKSLQLTISRNHDLAAIDEIIVKRKKRKIRRIEKSIAFFLSSDWALSNFNFVEYGHKENGTISEVILDKMLSKILWIKNPNITVSLNTIISLNFEGMFINRRVWEKFYNLLSELKKENKISDTDITMLLYHSSIEDTLKSIKDTELYEVNLEKVIDLLGESKSLDERIREEIYEEYEEKSRKLMTEAVEATELQIEKEWLNKVSNYKITLKSKSIKESNRISFIMSVAFSVIIFISIIKAYPFYKPILNTHIYVDLQPPILSLIISIPFNIPIWTYIRKRIKPYIVNVLYKNKLKNVETLLEK